MQNQDDKLKADYRKIKDNSNESGRAGRSSLIFEVNGPCFGNSPTSCPLVVIDALNTS